MKSNGSSNERNQTYLDGNPVSKSYVYSNVKPDVEPDKLMVVGKALGGLFDNEMTGLNVVERATLSED